MTFLRRDQVNSSRRDAPFRVVDITSYAGDGLAHGRAEPNAAALYAEMIMNGIRQLVLLTFVGGAIAVASATSAAAQKETCGAYKYHDEHSRKCKDARDRPSGKSWVDEQLAKKWAP